jgi:hypothetical protein
MHMAEVQRRASRTYGLESAVLETPEARDVVIDAQHLDAALAWCASTSSCFATRT